jgi:polysaccharide export outer membrane protein
MTRTLTLLLAASLLHGCTSVPSSLPTDGGLFAPADKSLKTVYQDLDALALFEATVDPVYRLGAGDRISVDVWGRPEVSGAHVIGPDGVITMPLVGPLTLTDTTREEAASGISRALAGFYNRPAVTLRVDQYTSNRVTVLGRVENPGSLSFDHQITLLEVLAHAGALPVIDKQATLTRCAVFRGRDQVIWVDLQHLLSRTDPAYNIRLKSGDLVYIPDSSDTMVYVLGAVMKPGAYRLTPDMSMLDALAQAGGPNEDARTTSISLHRQGEQEPYQLRLADLIGKQAQMNASLREGDVLYIDERGLAKVGYVMRQLLPGLSIMAFGLSASSRQ